MAFAYLMIIVYKYCNQKFCFYPLPATRGNSRSPTANYLPAGGGRPSFLDMGSGSPDLWEDLGLSLDTKGGGGRLTQESRMASESDKMGSR